jgi:integrase
MKLDSKTIATLQLPPGRDDVIYFDDELPRFGFRIRRNGAKVRRSWLVQYRRAGASRRLLIGSADVLPPEAARAAAKKALAKVALGEDPQADRVERRGRDRLTLRSVVDEFFAAKQPLVRPQTFRAHRRYLTGSYFRPLHGMAIDKVAKRDVATRLAVIVREHGSTTAARARAALSSFFVWAMTMGIAESNPIVGTLKPSEGEERTRVLTEAELAAVWNACRDDDHGRIVRLLILLGARRQEVGSITWSELDLEAGTWTLPPARSKNKRPHTLPLMPMVMQILAGVPRMAFRDQLFGRGRSGFSGWSQAKRTIDERSAVRDWTVHDIRRTVATKMADIGIAPHIVEEILNHRSGHRSGVAGTYNKSRYEREVRNALGLWADHVRTLVSGDERKVVNFAPGVAR